MSEPTVWTCEGAWPEAQLTYEKKWVYDGTDLWFHESWTFPDGRLARNNVHGLRVPGLPIEINSNDVTIGLTGAGMGGQQAVMQ